MLSRSDQIFLSKATDSIHYYVMLKYPQANWEVYSLQCVSHFMGADGHWSGSVLSVSGKFALSLHQGVCKDDWLSE